MCGVRNACEWRFRYKWHNQAADRNDRSADLGFPVATAGQFGEAKWQESFLAPILMRPCPSDAVDQHMIRGAAAGKPAREGGMRPGQAAALSRKRLPDRDQGLGVPGRLLQPLHERLHARLDALTQCQDAE